MHSQKSPTAEAGQDALSDEIAQATVYQHLRLICVYPKVIPQSATQTTSINLSQYV